MLQTSAGLHQSSLFQRQPLRILKALYYYAISYRGPARAECTSLIHLFPVLFSQPGALFLTRLHNMRLRKKNLAMHLFFAPWLIEREIYYSEGFGISQMRGMYEYTCWRHSVRVFQVLAYLPDKWHRRSKSVSKQNKKDEMILAQNVFCAYFKYVSILKVKVKGAAPLCNLSVWEPRFGGFTWGWEVRLVPSGTSQRPR